MSWRIIVCSLLAAGCSATVSDENEEGDPLKISYYRPNPHPRTKKPEPTYRVVMSYGWRDKVGESPREPLGKAAPGKNFIGYAPDRDLRRCFEQLRAAGIDSLRSVDPSTFRPDDLFRTATDPRSFDAAGQAFVRIFTVGTDREHRSFAYRDNQISREHIEKFRQCEKIVSTFVEMFSVQVETGVQPALLRDR